LSEGRFSWACPEFKFCLVDSATESTQMSETFRDRFVVTPSVDESLEYFIAGKCDVIPAHPLFWNDLCSNFDIDFDCADSKAFFPEILAFAAKEDDVIFSKFVDLVINAVRYAIHNDIYSADNLQMPPTNLFRPWVNDTAMLTRIVRAIVDEDVEIWYPSLKLW